MVSKKKKIAFLLAILLLLHTAISFGITKIIYDAIFCRYDAPESTVFSPELTEIMEPVSFLSGENTLSGKLFDGPGDALVVIVQGLHSHAGNYAAIIEMLVQQHQLDVFIFDMTGSGDSQGKNAIGFSQAVYDLNEALDYIDSACSYDDVFLLGHSRGGYAACCVLPGREDIDGVVAINSPNSPMDAVMGSSVNTVGWIAYGNYPMLYLYQAMLFDFKTVSEKASDVISQTDVPVLIIQAQQDETVRWDQFSIYANKDEISSDNTQFLLIDGNHSSVLQDPQNAIWDTISRFLRQAEI